MLLQVLLQYCRDGDRECHGAMPGVGLRLADHPPTLDAPHRALNAESTAGEDVGPAERVASPNRRLVCWVASQAHASALVLKTLA